MNIIIDARMIMKQTHGIGRFILETLRILQNRKIPHDITLLTRCPDVLTEMGLAEDFKLAEVKSEPFSPGDFFEIPRVLKDVEGDLYHAPSISVPLFPVMPTVITIHDLIPMYRGKMVHRVYCQSVLAHAVDYALAVITVSEFGKDAVQKTFGCPADKIHVIHDAASQFKDEEPSWEDIRGRLKIEKPYLFCLGNPRPHKNLTGLVDIYEIIRKKCDSPVKLVIGSKSSEQLKEKIEDSKFSKDIVRIDYIADADLPVVYKNAEVFVYPSYHEGFGIPPVEAMRFGCPVVSSDRTALKETVGEGGVLVDPDDKEKFADEVVRLLESGSLRKEWIGKGRKWQERYSWEESADRLLAVYEKVLRTG